MGRVLDTTHEIWLIGPGGDCVRFGECSVASGLLSKVRGLLMTERPEAGQGILLQGCNSIHTFGMSYPIDVYFLAADSGFTEAQSEESSPEGSSPSGKDSHYVVISVARSVAPWRLPISNRRATDVLEMVAPLQPEGRQPRVRSGDRLLIRPAHMG